jgi:uncharacterized protein (TIGR02147 family)
MNIYQAKTYHEFLRNWIKTLPNQGRGALTRLAKHTGIHTTTLSQIMKGSRSISLEQGVNVCEYLGLNESETKYFLLLLQIERAGTRNLRQIFEKELKGLKDSSEEILRIVPNSGEISDSEKSEFYSNWYYVGIAVVSSIPKYNSVEALCTYLGLSKSRVKQAVDFLCRCKVLIQTNGKIEPGMRSTHLGSKSFLINRHHSNWRVKAMERHSNMEESELAYSSPMSLSKKDSQKVKEHLLELIQKVGKIRDPSPCEEAFFLNIDWLKIQ